MLSRYLAQSLAVQPSLKQEVEISLLSHVASSSAGRNFRGSIRAWTSSGSEAATMAQHPMVERLWGDMLLVLCKTEMSLHRLGHI